MGYCNRQDVFRFVPAGILANPARLVSIVDISTDTISLDSHGLESGQLVTFRTQGGALPSPLVASTTYYARPLTDDTFQVSASSGGAVVNLSTVGSNLMIIAELPWSTWIDECSAMIDQTLVAHAVPIVGEVPEPVRLYCACLLAIRALSHVGASTEAVHGQLEFYSKQADKWARGVPLRGASLPAAGNLSVTVSGFGADPRGWCRGSGRIP